jgi:hypothetical protein
MKQNPSTIDTYSNAHRGIILLWIMVENKYTAKSADAN